MNLKKIIKYFLYRQVSFTFVQDLKKCFSNSSFILPLKINEKGILPPLPSCLNEVFLVGYFHFEIGMNELAGSIFLSINKASNMPVHRKLVSE